MFLSLSQATKIPMTTNDLPLVSQNSQLTSVTIAAPSSSMETSSKLATTANTEATTTTIVPLVTTTTNKVTSTLIEHEMKSIGRKLQELCHVTAEMKVWFHLNLYPLNWKLLPHELRDSNMNCNYEIIFSIISSLNASYFIVNSFLKIPLRFFYLIWNFWKLNSLHLSKKLKQVIYRSIFPFTQNIETIHSHSQIIRASTKNNASLHCLVTVAQLAHLFRNLVQNMKKLIPLFDLIMKSFVEKSLKANMCSISALRMN